MVVALTVTGTRPCTKATGTALVSVDTTVVDRRLVLGNLHSHSLCVECEKQGKLTQATVVDHIVPHRGDRSCSGMRATGSRFASLVMIRRPPGTKITIQLVLCQDLAQNKMRSSAN